MPYTLDRRPSIAVSFSLGDYEFGNFASLLSNSLGQNEQSFRSIIVSFRNRFICAQTCLLVHSNRPTGCCLDDFDLHSFDPPI